MILRYILRSFVQKFPALIAVGFISDIFLLGLSLWYSFSRLCFIYNHFRVANWSGMETAMGAGQVVDVCVNGKVKVWWASATEKQGITTECWPQDLYKVGILG